MGRKITMKNLTFFIFSASALVLVPATSATPSFESLLKIATGGEAESKTEIHPSNTSSEDSAKKTLVEVKPHARGRDLISNFSKELEGRSRGSGTSGSTGFTFPGPATTVATYTEVKKPIESGRDAKNTNNKDYLKSTASTAHEEEDRGANEHIRGPDYTKTPSELYQDFSPSYQTSAGQESQGSTRPSKGDYPYEFDKEPNPYSPYSDEEYHPMSHYKGQKYYYPKHLSQVSQGKQTQYYKTPSSPQNEYSHTVNHIEHEHHGHHGHHGNHGHYGHHGHHGHHGNYVESKGSSYGSGFGKALQVIIPSALFLTGVSALFPKKVKVPIENIDPNSYQQQQQYKNPYIGNIGNINPYNYSPNSYGINQYKRTKRSTAFSSYDEDYVEVPSKLLKIEHRMADEYDYADEIPEEGTSTNNEKRALNAYSGPKSSNLGSRGYLPTPETRVAAVGNNGRGGLTRQIEDFQSQFDELFRPRPQNVQEPKRERVNLNNHRVIQPVFIPSTSTTSTSTTSTSATSTKASNLSRNGPTQSTTFSTTSRIPIIPDPTQYVNSALISTFGERNTPKAQQQIRQNNNNNNNINNDNINERFSSPVPSVETPTPTPRRRFNNIKPYVRRNNLLKVTQYNEDGTRSEIRIPQRSLAREIIEENERRKALTTTPIPQPRTTTSPQPTEFDLALDSPVMGLLTNYAVHDNESPDCQKKALCELAQKGSSPSGTKFERFLWTLAELVPPSLSGMYDLEDIFGAIRTKSCSSYVCENPNVIIQEK